MTDPQNDLPPVNNPSLTEEELYEQEQNNLPYTERDYKQRKNPKIALMPPRAGVVVGTGPNKRVIDPEEVYKLAKLHCTYEEIAAWFGTTARIIKYNFVDVIAKGKAETKQRLRAALIETAIGGNATCIIWATKQWLGMSDSPVPESNENDAVEFNVKLVSANAEGEPVIVDNGVVKKLDRMTGEVIEDSATNSASENDKGTVEDIAGENDKGTVEEQ